MKRLMTILTVAAGLSWSQVAIGEEGANEEALTSEAEPNSEQVTGVVRVVGTAQLRQTILMASKDDGKGQALCANDAGKKIRRLGGMTVSAEGSWVMNRKGTKRKCFQVEEFQVTKTSSGREALVGVLEENNTTFSIRSDDGKITRLSKVPSGLRKLAGKKVILDIKSMHNLSGESAAQHVVSYSEFP